ncbi:MAG TPA: NAD(P)-dependent alcohol dehydrogenase [Ohtaekwangia sp.]|uniref:NAD(P)-dependent alcohol dehydrogenase n=1 Tax=Ohtaekwangia sp. TaxID=2066019 RepID=UPI002F9512D8
MKFKRVQFNQYGSASEMYMGEYELSQLKPDEVQVRVKAAAINPLDWKQRRGDMKLFMGRQFPKGIGSDFAGVVEAVGKDVRNIRPGDEVFGTMDVKKPGAFAEVAVTASRYVVRKPSLLSFAEAACLPIPAATAWAALLLGKKPVMENSRVLINGCTGAVGLMAVQLAIAKGAKVAGTCSEASMQTARAMGVHPTFNYADEQYGKHVKPFDVIFDTAGTMNVGRAVSMLKPKGMFVDINPTPRRIIRGLLSRRYRMVFANMGFKYLPEIADLANQNLLRSAIGLQADFSKAVSTITEFEKGQRTPGRVVLNF